MFDTRVYSAFSRLPRLSQFVIEGIVLEDEWKAKIKDRSTIRLKNAKRASMKINVLLSGPKHSAEEVAKTLAAYELYLQDPYSGLTVCSYENPQSLQLPQVAVSEDMLLDLEDFGCPEPEIEINLPTVSQDLEGNDLLAMVGDFFDEFTTQESLSEATTDVRIKTPLLRCSIHCLLKRC